MPTAEEKCPICGLILEESGSSGDLYQFRCTRCGTFQLVGTAKAMLKNEFSGPDDPRRAVLSHVVRKMQASSEWPLLTSHSYKQILELTSLPKPAEQARNLLLWLGTAAEASDSVVTISCEALQAIVGGRQPDSVYYVASHLQDLGLIKYDRTDTAKATPPLRFQMNFDGWDRYEALKNESTDSRTAFMAMKFGDPELNGVVEKIFRPAVAQTGFELRVLTDVPKAGLIDDRLRVEIRRSRFLIADITHKNPGAYWEAGFAEGLGKPVIYTCKKEAFDSGASHFDTNHHLTVMWNEVAEQVAEDLKATIRATLPGEAKLND